MFAQCIETRKLTKTKMANMQTHTFQSKKSGFTIIELMIAVAVVSILLAYAVPSMQEFMRNNRIQGESQRLFTILKQARNNAITTNTPSFVCRSTRAQNNVAGGGIACRTGGIDNEDWALEIMMYTALSDSVVPAPNNRFQNQRIQRIEQGGAGNAKRQEMLKAVSEAPNNSITVTANRDDFVIRFNQDGTLRNAAPYRFGICDNGANPEQYGRIIEINASGQIRLSQIEPSDEDRDCDPTTVE